jgi:hypothetical protein
MPALKQTDKMKPDTEQIVDDLKAWIPLSSPLDKILNQAADRLEELQRMNESMQVDRELWIKVGREKLESISRQMIEERGQAIKERDEARAEVEFHKEAHAKCRQYLATALDKVENQRTEMTRPEPSRLEIAAMLKAGWFANRDADFNATDHKWWIEQADALIAAAKEGK